MPHGLFLDLVLVYAIALAVIIAAGSVGVPAVIALIATGTLAGPSGFGIISTPEEVDQLAEIGVALLLFTVGLDFPMRELKRMWRSVVAAGALQVAGTTAVVTGVTAVSGMSLRAALFTGLFMALSSTAIVLKELARRNRLDSPAGRMTTGVLLFQDLCVVLLLLAAPVLAGPNEATSVPAVLGRGFAAVVGIFVIARLILPLVFRLVTACGQRDAFPLAVLVGSVGTAALGASLGVSMALGAFLAGLVLAGSEFSHQAHAEVRPLRDLLTSVFFISLGMLIDVSAFAQNLPWIVGVAATAIVLKGIVAGSALLAVGTPVGVAAASTLYLAQVGEFSFVLGRDALRLGILSADVWQVLLPASILTMLVAPTLIALGPAFAGRVTPRGAAPIAEQLAVAGHVIILGFGVGGRLVAAALREFGIPYLIIDLNGAAVREARAAGVPITYGDATAPDTLEAAGLDRARSVVVMLSDPDAAMKIVTTARRLAPDLTILVRARYRAEAARLQEAGAVAVAEELEASLELLGQLLARLDVPGNIVQVMLEDFRRRENTLVTRGHAPPRVALEQLAPELLSQPVATHQLQDGDWAIGHSLADLNLRAETGASVLAVRRDGEYRTSPPPDFGLAAGDVLYLLGDDSDVMLARQRLTEGAG